MDKIFSGLEDFGFKDLNNVDIFKTDDAAEKKSNKFRKEFNPLDCIFDRNMTCPVCGNDVKIKSVKTGKVRMISKDTDFMPRYEKLNPLFYDVAVCPSCGYSALVKSFGKLREEQINLIKSIITPKFIPKTYPDLYDVDIAIERFKLALLNSVVKKGKSSEKAYLCLKLSWFYRLKNEEKEEKRFIEQSLIGFKEAYEKETFPIYGMDKFALIYLIGELSRRIGKNDEALRWLSMVLISMNVNPKLKELARDQKDLIKESRAD